MIVRFASFLGDNALEFYLQIVDYLGQVTGLQTELVSGLPPSEQEQMVQQGQIQVVYTCGLPYVRKADQNPPQLQVMVAPVLTAKRYHNQAVYFSDVIVRTGTPYHSLAGLQGATFAYNEVHSLSGYISMCYRLLTLGETPAFFDQWVPSGSHANSMDLVEQGQVDAAAIDSVVLAMELVQKPERVKCFRVVEKLGPRPMPPIAAVSGLADHIRQQLVTALTTMHRSKSGQQILAHAGVKCFQPMIDRDYDTIRQIMRDLRESGMIELQ